MPERLVQSKKGALSPTSNNASRRAAKPAFGTAVGSRTCCCVARAGGSNRRRRGGFIESCACNCGAKRPSAGSRPSSGRIAGMQPDRTKPGLWTSCGDPKLGLIATAPKLYLRRSKDGSSSSMVLSWRHAAKGGEKLWALLGSYYGANLFGNACDLLYGR